MKVLETLHGRLVSDLELDEVLFLLRLFRSMNLKFSICLLEGKSDSRLDLDEFTYMQLEQYNKAATRFIPNKTWESYKL